jgi:hypothetical protein
MRKITLLVLLCQFQNLNAANLIGGKVSKSYPEVMLISSGNGMCSASMIGPNTLVTAGHCIDKKTMEVSFEKGQGSCKYHPQWIDRSQGLIDLALCKTNRIELDRYAQIAEENEMPRKGEKILLTGYGCTSGDQRYLDGKYRIGYAKVTRLPRGLTPEFWTEGSTALCFGDSGGPAFKRGTHKIYGINSKGDIKKISIMVSIGDPRVYDFLHEFIKSEDSLICGMNISC